MLKFQNPWEYLYEILFPKKNFSRFLIFSVLYAYMPNAGSRLNGVLDRSDLEEARTYQGFRTSRSSTEILYLPSFLNLGKNKNLSSTSDKQV